VTYRLYDFAASPFCIKARAMLDYKGVRYERLSIVGWRNLELRKRGRIGKVPALDIDGRLVCDSTDIAEAIEERHPEPPLFPSEPKQRAWNHVLEEWADESLYFYGLYYRWQDDAGRRTATAKVFPPGTGWAFGAAIGGTARRRLEAQGVGRKSPEHVARDLRRHLDRLEELLDGSDYLLGDRPYLCDFAVMGQLVYLKRTPTAGATIEPRREINAYLDRIRTLRT